MKPAKAQLAIEQAARDAVDHARNAGGDYFKQSPELMLIEVSRHASTLHDDKNHVVAFLQGYSAARGNHDAFKRGE